MRERFRKKLDRYLELAPDEAFFQLVWAANMIQAGYPESGIRYLKNVSQEAITEDLPNPRHIHKWELETIISELLTVPKRGKPLRGQWRELDCTRYDAFVDIINKLRNLENEESGLRLKRINVLREMPRIIARQLDWQRGWFNVPQFYRSTFIYGQGACAEYFEKAHGLTINQFSLIGFALHTSFCENPIIMRNFDFSPVPINDEVYQRALHLLCVPIVKARSQAEVIHRKLWPVAYQPSLLRQFPCISFGEGDKRIRSPLPQLILERVTAGIFYDVAGAGRNIRDEYGRRFEQYALRYLQAALPGIGWQPEQDYRIRKEGGFKSPDILWVADDGLRLAIECKATRMSIDARFADDPLQVRGYDDMIKAVFQLWRYFSHCRRGHTNVTLYDGVVGMVLTLDSWLQMANDLIEEILEAATVMAIDRDPLILLEDRKPIIFCAMTDLESVLTKATETTFEAAVRKTIDDNRVGWMLSSVHDEVVPDDVERKPYPFRDNLAQLLPWWGWIEDEKQGRAAIGDVSS